MKKIVFILLAAVMVLNISMTAYSQKTDIFEDTLLFAEGGFFASGQRVYTIQSGNISFRCSVINTLAHQRSISVTMALYKNNYLINSATETTLINPGQNRLISKTMTVPSGTGHEMKVFLNEEINIGYPLRSVFSLTNKSSEKEITCFSIRGFDGEINHTAKLVEVLVPYGTPLSGIEPEVTVSDGATVQIQDNNYSTPVKVEVTAEDGTSQTYTVRTVFDIPPSGYYFEDFSTMTPNAVPTKWVLSNTAGGTVTVGTDPDDETNLVLKVDDTSTSASVSTYVDFPAIYPPFEVSFRIRYDRLPVFSDSNNVSYSWTNFGLGGTIMGGMSEKDSASRQTFMYKSTSEREVTTTIMQVNYWHDIKMVYGTDNMVSYYVDGEFVVKADACNARSYTTRLTTSSTVARTSILYLDDIEIKHIEGEEDYNFFDDFEEYGGSSLPSEIWHLSGGQAYIEQDGLSNGTKALRIEDTSDSQAVVLGRKITPINGNSKISYDFMLPDDLVTTGSGIRFKFGSGDLASAMSDSSCAVLLSVRSTLGVNTLAYKADGEWYDIAGSDISSGEWNKLVIDYYYDEDYELYFAEVYLNNNYLATLLQGDIYGIDKIEVVTETSGRSTIWIDNLSVSK